MIAKKILDCGKDSKQLFSIVNAITNNKQINPLPVNNSHEEMANGFLHQKDTNNKEGAQQCQ